jgi:hypothetical protein
VIWFFVQIDCCCHRLSSAAIARFVWIRLIPADFLLLQSMPPILLSIVCVLLFVHLLSIYPTPFWFRSTEAIDFCSLYFQLLSVYRWIRLMPVGCCCDRYMPPILLSNVLCIAAHAFCSSIILLLLIRNYINPSNNPSESPTRNNNSILQRIGSVCFV